MSLTCRFRPLDSIRQDKKALAGARRYNHAIAVIMLDIDHFKSFNDNYGHQAGDDILCTIADVLSANLRDTDSCGRYGGEEFILILTHSELFEVKTLADRIKSAISNATFERAPGAKATAILGITMCYPTQSDNFTADTLIAAAARALNEAKNLGRNRVCFSPNLHSNNT